MVSEHPRWTKFQLWQEMQKYFEDIPAFRVYDMLYDMGYWDASTKIVRGIPWKEFLQRFEKVTWAGDFFSTEVWTDHGQWTFFTLFFSIIVGDAGYGLLYLLAGIILKIKVKSKGAQQAINFLIILSCGTVAWGLLTGSVFGIKKDLLPWFLAGLPCLRGEQSMKCIQWLCFTIALCHLAGARLWRAIIAGSVREALGNLGWMFFISFNFLLIISMIVGDPFPFTAHPGFEAFPSWCYCGGGIGAILILLFSVKWKEIGDVLYTPFNFINSFVDVLSYIRLFAVGLSGAYIAQCFNNMGGMIYAGQTGWKLVILAICGGLVIIIGHILNIVLGMMSVLVHGLRLNTLEFSNHMQIGWEGKAYSPFRETNEQ